MTTTGFQWAYFSWLQMLWMLKQNLSKLIDFYLFYAETWEKTKSYHRRGEEDASLWNPTFSLDFIWRVRRGGWCSQNKAPIDWRSDEVSIFFHNLDSRYRESMSNQQRRQCVNRRVGPPSTRDHNEVPESLLWAIKL